MRCPQCNREGFEEIRDEVDIGVGVLEHLTGGACVNCGEMSVCEGCEAWDFEEHYEWCLMRARVDD